MRTYLASNVLLSSLVVAIPVLTVAWFIAVPAVLTPANFAVLAGLVVGLSWVLKTTYSNAQPASSLAQSLHDADAVSRDRATNSR